MSANPATQATQQPPPPPVEENVDLELVDDEQILAELRGVHFENDKYVFPVHGGHQLTYRAIKLACRMFEERGEALEVIDLTTKYDEKDPEYMMAHAKVQRVKITAKGQRIVLGSEVGTKRKWMKERLKSGEIRVDPSFYEKMTAQAQRNGKAALLPQDFLLEFKKMILANQGKPPARPPAQQAPQTQNPPAEPQKGAAKPPATPPAQPPAKPAGQPPAQGAEKRGPGRPPGSTTDPEKKRKLTLMQQFWAVFKAAFPALKTEELQREVLKKVTGKGMVRELDEEFIKKLGPQLRLVSQGESAIREIGGVYVIVHGPTGEVRWPEGYKLPEEQPAAAPAGDAVQGEEEPLF